MKEKFEVAYIPVGVPTFHLESAEACFRESLELLRDVTDVLVYPDEMLLSIDLLKEFLGRIDPDLIILQNVTFANAAYASEVQLLFPDRPVILWALREPVIDGGRLRLNSLTGVFSASNVLHELGRNSVPFLFGGPSEKEIREKLIAAVGAAKVRKDLNGLTLAAIGHSPQGFGFGRALDAEIQKSFGVRLLSVEAREFIEMAKSYSDPDIQAYLEDAGKRMSGLDSIPEKNRNDFARLYKAYDSFVLDKGVGAIASRCWPDFFTSFGTPVCAVLSILNDLGIPSACETDVYGALSMYIGSRAGDSPVFFGDPVSMDEKENTITFWHCGMAPCSIAREGRSEVGVHCNRKIGPTMEFGCRESENAVIFRVGKDPKGGWRFFVAEGRALDKPKQFNGTSTVIETVGSAKDIITAGIRDGWEPHFAVIYSDVAETLSSLGEILDIPVFRY